MRLATQLTAKSVIAIIFFFYTITGYSKVIGNVISVADDLNFGQVLIGGAEVKADTIQWVGSSSTDLLFLVFTLPKFGFTGEHHYNNQGKLGEWRIETSSAGYSIGSPASNGNAPKIGIYFAPQHEGANDTTFDLSWTQRMVESAQGTGVSDVNGALSLEILSEGQSGEGTCEGEANCKMLSVNESSPATVSFTVTPQVDTTKVPAGVKADYLLIKLDVVEKNTQCSTNNTAFQERFGSSLSYVTPDQYFDYLNPLKPEETSATCRRTHLFLVSKDYPIKLTAGKIKNTGTGYVEYKFSIVGHDGQSFRLTTAEVKNGDQNPALTVNVIGNGSVASDLLGISDCTSAGGQNCTTDFATGTTIQLLEIPTDSINTVSWAGDCDANGQVIMGSVDMSCTAIFAPIVTELPSLGSGTGIDTFGNSITTNANFHGGILVNNQIVNEVILADNVNVKGEIGVDSGHIGQTAEIVVFASHNKDSGTRDWYFLNVNGNPILWESNIDTMPSIEGLEPFKTGIALEQTQPVDMYKGQFVYPGGLNIFFGYRLEGGNVIYNTEPMIVNIVETQ